MIRNRNYVPMDPQKKELPEGISWTFDLVANEGDICQYAASFIPAHWHKETELFLLTEGCVRIQIPQKTLTLHAGEGCFLNNGIIHSFHAASFVCRYRSFVFDAGIVSGTPGSIFDAKYIRPLLERGPAIFLFEETDSAYREAFTRAFYACDQEPYAYEFIVREALSSILLYVRKKSGLLPETMPIDRQEQRLKQMVTFIRENLSSSVTLADIAACANICSRECQRIFSAYLHVSPMEYLLLQRILKATEEITSTNKEITAIALDCGFNSPSYFSKQFRRIIGCSPLHYRTEPL